MYQITIQCNYSHQMHTRTRTHSIYMRMHLNVCTFQFACSIFCSYKTTKINSPLWFIRNFYSLCDLNTVSNSIVILVSKSKTMRVCNDKKEEEKFIMIKSVRKSTMNSIFICLYRACIMHHASSIVCIVYYLFGPCFDGNAQHIISVHVHRFRQRIFARNGIHILYSHIIFWNNTIDTKNQPIFVSLLLSQD